MGWRWVALLALQLLAPAAAFYLPGVAPQDYAKARAAPRPCAPPPGRRAGPAQRLPASGARRATRWC